jgi:hypothetical protein
MDQEPNLMNKNPDEIREDIEGTRSALTEKLETLEQEVKGTVYEAKAAVTDTIEDVKETVKETVETVKESLDIRGYVGEYPWPMMVGSVALGFAFGRLISTKSGNGHKISRMDPNGAAPTAGNNLASRDDRRREPRSSLGVLGSLMEKIRPEIQEIEGIAIGAIGALIRDLIKHNTVEPIAEQLEPIANRLTSKFGGCVIEEPLLPEDGDET